MTDLSHDTKLAIAIAAGVACMLALAIGVTVACCRNKKRAIVYPTHACANAHA